MTEQQIISTYQVCSHFYFILLMKYVEKIFFFQKYKTLPVEKSLHNHKCIYCIQPCIFILVVVKHKIILDENTLLSSCLAILLLDSARSSD